MLEHGLFGLSLRPLADALGTSDRMLIYHFGTKDDLVVATMQCSNDRSVAFIHGLPRSPDLRSALIDLWGAISSPEILPCTRLYIEASALGLFGSEPYASGARSFNAEWTGALVSHVVRAGLSPDLAGRVIGVVDAAFLGFVLDMPLYEDASSRLRAVEDVAAAALLIAGS